MRRSMTISVFLAALLATAVASAFEPGERVLARWSGDALLYPGRVQSVDGATVTIAFDDGDVAAVSAEDVKDLDWRAGTRLQCNWKNQGTYYGGVVARMDGEVIDFQYDDGYRETMTISRCRQNG